MNWYEGLIRTSQQKPSKFSAKGLINLVLASLFLCTLSPVSSAQKTQEDYFYLNHSLLISPHLTDSHSSFDTQAYSFQNTSLSNFDTYSLEDADPYYFAFDSNNCQIDPFTSSEDGSENKQLLATCLKNQLWENENIPLWIRATGATVLIGAAGSAGKVDDDLKFTMGFDKMDSILRDWLSNKEQ